MENRMCEDIIDDFPNHSIPIELRICADARKDQCPYCIVINIDNAYISFKQCFCGYQFRKDISLEQE